MSNPELGHDDEMITEKSKSHQPGLGKKLMAGAAAAAALGVGTEAVFGNEAANSDKTSAATTEAPTSVEQTITTEVPVLAATEYEQAFAEKIANGESFDVLYGKIAKVQVAVNPNDFIVYEINDPIELKSSDGKVTGVIGLMQTDELPSWHITADSSAPKTSDVFRPITVIFGEQTEAGNSTVDFAGLSKAATFNLAEADQGRTPINANEIASLPTTSTVITKNESGVYSDSSGSYVATAVDTGYAGSAMSMDR